ncbi:sulfatase-like hydrolase/transferase [Spirosoma montaniterrae]|uniref:Sulfatase n=1 Tax=Spirosoma montaniterrae TaxID=1178516 RepID=A0A1P9WTV8_9BACT|nr:sulfatase-like hydrolase/transferase [Spirosoma montaniterrae]AQG78826.1 sulfatase [Spirosoma montaniterrae]
MHRFLFVAFSGVGIGLLLVAARLQPAGLGLATQVPVSRPNILWLSCEDMSPHLGCYGDTTVPTPNIDRLAREGIRFSNAFCTAGVCAPSRNAIITGMYQTSTGGHNMRTLNNAYPEKTGLPKAYSIVPASDVRAFPEYLRRAGYYTTNNSKTDYQFEEPPTVWNEVSNKAHWRNRQPGQPFFAVFNNTVTHESQVWARKSLPLRVDPARISVPPYYPDTKTVRQDMARFFSNIRDMDDWVGQLLKQLDDDGLLQHTIIFFWSDHGDGLPFVKREIYDRGIRVPLVVRFPDGQGAGSVRTDLMSMIDLAPTVLSLAGLPSPKHMQGRALLGKYAVKKPRQYVFAARDRLDERYDRVRSVHDGRYQYVRNFYPDRPLYMDVTYRKQQPMMAEMLRLRDEGKLNPVQMNWFRTTKPVEELYDIQADPYQLTNLADQPAEANNLKRLRKELDRWLVETKDLGGIPEKELIRQWWEGADKPPITATPTGQQQGNRLSIRCATPGASIAYKTAEQTGSDWQVYTQPLRLAKPGSVTAVARRIGYGLSAETVF